VNRFLFLLASFLSSSGGHAAERPNIVWIVGEDMGPELGCYGDTYARTPNLDRLASEGSRFTHCFTHAPVCAPSRSGLITGRYPTSIGSHHMRSKLLAHPPTFTSLWLRDTKDLGAVPERELIERGLVADKLTEYQKRVKPLPERFRIR
jgi:hypothetical protein